MDDLEFLGTDKFKFLACTPEQQKSTGSIKGRRDELDWIKRQLEYADLAEKYKLRYDLKRGEVYLVDWGININSEFSNMHYGVVLADSNEFNPMVIMCPLKALGSEYRRIYDLDLGLISEFSFNKHMFAIVHQTRCLDKLRIRKVGVAELFYKPSKLAEGTDINQVYRLSEEKVQLILMAYSNILNGSSQE